MRALSFKIPKTENQSFRVQIDDMPLFYDQFHYHPEIQISIIFRGSGTRFIGDNINSFQSGQVFVIGSNIPHVFRSDKSEFEKFGQNSYSVSLYFKEDSLGSGFFDLPENVFIKDFINLTAKGIEIVGESRSIIIEKVIEIVELNGFPRLIKFLEILAELSNKENHKYLCKGIYSVQYNERDGKKMNDVLGFVFDNFSKNIRLEDVSSIAGMSQTSFCRFFKSRTRKTFINFLNEIRIGEACKLLGKDGLNVSEICYAVGFNNISNFNRKFKEITNYTPKEYLNKYKN